MSGRQVKQFLFGRSGKVAPQPDLDPVNLTFWRKKEPTNTQILIEDFIEEAMNEFKEPVAPLPVEPTEATGQRIETGKERCCGLGIGFAYSLIFMFFCLFLVPLGLVYMIFFGAWDWARTPAWRF